MLAAGGGDGGSSQAAQASAPVPSGDTSLLGSARTWPLKRYGRFLPPTDDDGEGQNISWKVVFESNEESGHLVLTIVVSGHFFISQGRMVLEGFSLIDSHKWLKIVRRADCLLLRAHSKCISLWQGECRMFRVQFGGSSREQMLGHCCSCVGKLMEYLPVETEEEQSQLLCPSLSQLGRGENQEMETEPNTSGQYRPDEPPADSCTSLGERRSVTQLAQAVLRKRLELPLGSQHPGWQAQQLGPLIRLCLMDQNFPAFVEDVEKELKKLMEG
ncbi:RE114 protein, partial [Alcedo cyanopectus]|nr:RE114 protein [Ceyx cyanopectus]